MLERIRQLNDYPSRLVPPSEANGITITKTMVCKTSGDVETQGIRRHGGAVFRSQYLSEDGTTRAYPVGWSNDYRYATFNFSKAVPIWVNFGLWTLPPKSFCRMFLPDMRHSGASWYKDGFYYSAYDKTQDYQAQDRDQKIYYHRLGDSGNRINSSLPIRKTRCAIWPRMFLRMKRPCLSTSPRVHTAGRFCTVRQTMIPLTGPCSLRVLITTLTRWNH
jgi:hypothetical protein